MTALVIRCALVSALIFFCAPVFAEWHSTETTRYTTKVELVFCHDDSVKFSPEELSKRVLQRFDEVDALMSTYLPDSEVSKLNKRSGKGSFKASPQLFKVLEHAQSISAISSGAFDISYASVGYHYDYRAKAQPTDSELEAGLNRINYRNILLDKKTSTVGLQQEGMRIDLGGIAKGYAVDLGIQELKAAGVKHARLGAGGDMYLLGDKRGKPWVVGVRDPRVEQGQAMVLPLVDTAVSTSGDYERFFIDEQGERVHHILSPTTGKPVKGIQSVTILGDRVMETDALSTAVFVGGIEKGLSMINAIPRIDAIIIDANRKVHYSDGLAEPE